MPMNKCAECGHEVEWEDGEEIDDPGAFCAECCKWHCPNCLTLVDDEPICDDCDSILYPEG